MKMLGVCVRVAKVKGFRSPSAQISFRAPGVLKNGLSVGIDPSEFSRRILPNRLDRSCEWPLVALSPTAM
jgi:hypothetical protein